MKYRYNIYEQTNLTDQFDKYNLEDYTFRRAVTCHSQWSIKPERDREWFTVIRKNFAGDITVHGADYDWMMTLEGSTRWYVVIIEVERANKWVELWRGFFSFFDFQVDRDKCVLKFTPAVWDEYTQIYDQMNIEENILALCEKYPIIMDTFEFEHESIMHIHRIDYPDEPFNPGFVEYSAGDPNPTPNEYYTYSRKASWHPTFYDEELGIQYYYWKVTDEYRRDITYHNTDDPGLPPPGGNWVYDSEYLPGIYKWVRKYKNGNHAGFIFQETQNARFWTLNVTLAGVPVFFGGGIRLNEALSEFAGLCGLEYKSNFFEDDPCPMGGTTLVDTMLLQISNFRKTTSYATVNITKLKDFLSMIRDTFNVYWYIDEDGYFRFEHRKYFDFGLSYIYNVSIYSDLRGRNIGNEYKWERPSLSRWERIVFPYSYFADWIDSLIEYPAGSIMGNDYKDYKVDWGTDLIAMYEERENLPKMGWALINARAVMGGARYVNNSIGALTGASFQNARFSNANLMRDLWTFGRLLPTGRINGNNTTFDTIQRLRKQVEFSIPMCEDINYNGIFRTELGDGQLETAEYESKSGTLKMNLIYE